MIPTPRYCARQITLLVCTTAPAGEISTPSQWCTRSTAQLAIICLGSSRDPAPLSLPSSHAPRSWLADGSSAWRGLHAIRQTLGVERHLAAAPVSRGREADNQPCSTFSAAASSVVVHQIVASIADINKYTRTTSIHIQTSAIVHAMPRFPS